MGGELKITAKFPEGTVEIPQFEGAKKTESSKDELERTFSGRCVSGNPPITLNSPNST
jgi:hypothetical protein